MTEEQILDYLEAVIYTNLEIEFQSLRDNYKNAVFDAKLCKKLLHEDAVCAIHLMDVFDYIKDKKAKLKSRAELADVSDEALVQEVKDRGLEKYL